MNTQALTHTTCSVIPAIADEVRGLWAITALIGIIFCRRGRQMLIDKQTARHVPHMGVDVLVINYITLGQGLPVDDGFYLSSIYHQHCGKKKNANTPKRREVRSSPECSLIGWSYSAQPCHYDLDSCAAAAEQYSHVHVLWLTPALWFNPVQIHTSMLHVTV